MHKMADMVCFGGGSELSNTKKRSEGVLKRCYVCFTRPTTLFNNDPRALSALTGPCCWMMGTWCILLGTTCCGWMLCCFSRAYTSLYLAWAIHGTELLRLFQVFCCSTASIWSEGQGRLSGYPLPSPLRSFSTLPLTHLPSQSHSR